MSITRSLVLDAPAVDRLLTRPYKSTPARLIVPEQAFDAPAGQRRRTLLEASSWAGRVEVMDVSDVPELQEAATLRRLHLTASQSSGLVLARRLGASLVARVCPVLLMHGARFLGEPRIVDVSSLWVVLGVQ